MSDEAVDTPTSSTSDSIRKGTKRRLSQTTEHNGNASSPKQSVSRPSVSQDNTSSSEPSSSSRSSDNSMRRSSGSDSWSDADFTKLHVKVDQQTYSPSILLHEWLYLKGKSDEICRQKRDQMQRLKEFIHDVTEVFDMDVDCISEIPTSDLDQLRVKILDKQKSPKRMLKSTSGQFCEVCSRQTGVSKMCADCWKFCCAQCYDFHQTKPGAWDHRMIDLKELKWTSTDHEEKSARERIFESIQGKGCENCGLQKGICKICKMCWKFYCKDCNNVHQRITEDHDMVDIGTEKDNEGTTIYCVLCKEKPFCIICKACPGDVYCEMCAMSHVTLGRELTNCKSKMCDLRVAEKLGVERDIAQSTITCTVCEKEQFSVICKECPQIFYCLKCAWAHVRISGKENHTSHMFDLTELKTVAQNDVIERSEVNPELENFFMKLYLMRGSAKEHDSSLIEGNFLELFVRFLKIFGISDIIYGADLQCNTTNLVSRVERSTPDCVISIPYKQEKSVLAVIQVMEESSDVDIERLRILGTAVENYTPAKYVNGKIKETVAEMVSVLPFSVMGEKGVLGMTLDATEVTLACFNACENYLERLKNQDFPKNHLGASVKFSVKCNILKKEDRKALAEIFFTIALLSNLLKNS